MVLFSLIWSLMIVGFFFLDIFKLAVVPNYLLAFLLFGMSILDFTAKKYAWATIFLVLAVIQLVFK